MIPVFYRPEQSCAAAVSYSPSAGKPKLVLSDWLARPAISQHIQVKSFAPASDDVLGGTHDPDYVQGVLSGRIANGFGTTSPDLAKSLRYTVGSVAAAATHVLSAPIGAGMRVAVSPTSGFHHAGYDFGGAFCTFNGLLAAAMHVHSLGLAKRILILDMDQHYGNGTADIIKRLGIDYVDHITASRSYRTAEQALACADLGANKSVRAGAYDLVIYQAGADIHIDDPLGGLLTSVQMIERDAAVFKACSAHGLPLVWNLAGGYNRDAQGTIAPVLELHRNTMIECIKASSKTIDFQQPRTPMPYTVHIDDNFHYRDTAHRINGRVFETAEQALAYCQSLVNDYLVDQHRPGMTAEALYSSYTMFGDDPFIVTSGADPLQFSAWDYARERSAQLCAP